MNFLKFFDLYVKIGLKPIAINKQSKRPICKNWQDNWSVDRWRGYFHHDKFNMGILLGDIVDVEGDSEEANKLINDLIGSYPHPQFTSLKSTHHLFKTPLKNLTRIAYKGVEFRGRNHQSLIPPSCLGSKTSYRWLQESTFEIPEMPLQLLDYFLEVYSKQKANKKNPFHNKTKNLYSTICKSCEKRININQKRLLLEVKAFQRFNLNWACNKCRTVDIRPLCRNLKKQSNY